MNQGAQLPYQRLGERLKLLREGKNESLALVSEAVEIAENDLKQFEHGANRPSEEILILLLNHFDVEESHANELWQLAGYSGAPGRAHIHDDNDFAASSNDDFSVQQKMMMIMVDPRVMYSDGVEAVAGDQGVVLNFSQTNGPGGAPLVVSRVGMSKEQAGLLLGVLNKVLNNKGNNPPRRLGQGNSK